MNRNRLSSPCSNPRNSSDCDFSTSNRVWSILVLLLGALGMGSLPDAHAQSDYSAPYVFTTFAGPGVPSRGSADGTIAEASFFGPAGVAVDAAGDVFVADSQNHKIRKISAAGVVSTVAGYGIPGAVDGTGAASFFTSPNGVALDASGNLFVADTGNHKIRKITPAGVVTSVAGSGVSGSADGSGAAATFNFPFAVAIDSGGNLYVADSSNNKIRKITPAGVVSTLAGSGASGSSNGNGTAATFNNPYSVAADAGGNVFVADRNNHRIRKITSAGVVTTFAGSGSEGGVDGPGTTAQFSQPEGVAVDGSGNVFVGDTRGQKIRKITPAGVVSTLAGSEISGALDGSGTAASFVSPKGVAVSASGNVFVADSSNDKIRKISSAGVVTTFAGLNRALDGTGPAAGFNRPKGVAVDASGNVFVADSYNGRIRKITSEGVVATFAGPGSSGNLNGTGTAASFNQPSGLAVDSSGNVFVADTWNSLIRKITPAGVVTTFAGSGSQGGVNGTGIAASFRIPEDVAVDASGNVFVADTQNHQIRKITPAGVVTTFAGSATSGNADGTGTAAGFNYPSGVAVDASGNVFVADTYNYKIRKITPAGVVTTLAGLGYQGSRDGTSSVATFAGPVGVAVDALGKVFVTDEAFYRPHRIRVISPDAVVSTIAGSDDFGSADGTGAAASFWAPDGIAVDASGNVFVADSANNKIRKGVPGGLVAQMVTFNPLSPKASADAPFAITASASSGLPVGFTIVSGPAALTGNTVTLTGSGTVVVSAIQPGNASFQAAPPVYQSFIVAAGANAQSSGYDFTTLLDPAASPLVALDAGGNLFVGGYGSDTIRKITPAGVVSTFATATGVTFGQGMALDAAGNLFVASSTRIYKITPAGVATVIAGSGSQGNANGIGTAASFWDARGIAVDAGGNMFVTDRYNCNIRKITPAGVVTTFAGSGSQGSADGIGMAASFYYPLGLAIDATGHLYVADSNNHKIRKITPVGVVTTLAGTKTSGSADGTGTAAKFSYPQGLMVDLGGNVFVADTNNHKIRKITPRGEVTTVAGSGIQGSVNGTSKVVSFYGPTGVAVDAGGNLFVADFYNNKVRKGTPTTVTILPQTITFGALENKTTDDVFVVLGATASSTLPVAYSIVSGPATITGNAITLNGSGTVTVRVEQAGNDFYSAAPPVDQSFVVTAVTSIAPQTYTISKMAGSGALPEGSADGAVTTASFNYPSDVAVDSNGNLFVADKGNNKIRKITPAGVVTTLAGSGNQGSADGSGAAASFNSPEGVAVDSGGNIFVADTYNNTIRKITAAGIVSTLAGSAYGSSGSVDGTGSAASFSNPSGVAVDTSGNIFVADTYNYKIRKITPAGVVSTLAGSGSQGSVNGTGTAASFGYFLGVAVDASGNVFVADTANNKIRKITPAGVVTTLAGSGSQGSADGTGTAASFSYPSGVSVDTGGNVFVADTDNRKIRKITPAGVVTTIAGSSRWGAADGSGAAASFQAPMGVAVDASGNVFVADANNHNIRKITPAGMVNTVSGTNMAVDGNDITATFWNPIGVAMDASGNVFVADCDNNRIRKITPAGAVTTFAGSGRPDSADGTGAVAGFFRPTGVAVDASGNVFVADNGNMKIRKITPAGEVSTLAGNGTYGQMNGTGTAASFAAPVGVAVDLSGNLFVTENGRIRKVTSAGVVTIFSGTGSSNGYLDGPAGTAGFKNPSGIAVDLSGHVYVADTGNHKIRKITPGGEVSTLAGSGSVGSIDGTSMAARFSSPEGVAVDIRGNVFVADTFNNEIRKITRAGVVTTVAGSTFAGSTDGIGAMVGFYRPKGVAIDAGGNLVIADSGNNRIRKGSVGLTQVITFNPLPDRIVGDAPFALIATASSGLPVTFSILSGPVTLSGDTGTLTGPGTVVVRASQAGNTSYAAASAVDQSFIVTGNSVPAAALNNWATSAGLSGPNTAPDATPFNDGVENILKYAFNMNAAGPDVSVLTTGGTAGLPQIAVDSSGAEPVLKVAFLRRKGSGLIYTPQRSDTLGDFAAMTGTQTVTSIDAQWERVTVEEPAPPATAPSAFARVQVSLP